MIFIIDLFYHLYYIDCVNITALIPTINSLAAQVENLQINYLHILVGLFHLLPECETFSTLNRTRIFEASNFYDSPNATFMQDGLHFY